MYVALGIEMVAVVCIVLRLFSRWWTMSRFETDDYMMIVVLVCRARGYRSARREANVRPVQILFIVFEVVGHIGAFPTQALGLETSLNVL